MIVSTVLPPSSPLRPSHDHQASSAPRCYWISCGCWYLISKLGGEPGTVLNKRYSATPGWGSCGARLKLHPVPLSVSHLFISSTTRPGKTPLLTASLINLPTVCGRVSP